MNQWNKTRDGLPEEGAAVLCHKYLVSITDAYSIQFHDGDAWVPMQYKEYPEPDHWMYIPPPPAMDAATGGGPCDEQ